MRQCCGSPAQWSCACSLARRYLHVGSVAHRQMAVAGTGESPGGFHPSPSFFRATRPSGGRRERSWHAQPQVRSDRNRTVGTRDRQSLRAAAHRAPRIAFLNANHIATESFVLAPRQRALSALTLSLRLGDAEAGGSSGRRPTPSGAVVYSSARDALVPKPKQQRCALCSLNPRCPVAWIGAARLAVDPQWRRCFLSHCDSARKRSQTCARTISSRSPSDRDPPCR
jgi:hypothetical protein